MAADAIGRGAARLLVTALLLVIVAAMLVPIGLGLPTPWQAVATFLATWWRPPCARTLFQRHLRNAYADSNLMVKALVIHSQALSFRYYSKLSI